MYYISEQATNLHSEAAEKPGFTRLHTIDNWAPRA